MIEGGISYGITKDDPPAPPRPAVKRRPITLIKARIKNKCPCSVPNCASLVYARGLCRIHYQRWRKHGSTDDPPVRRFWRNVRRTEGCWEWASYKNDAGYAQMRVANKTTYAHRFAYELLVGPIPKGLELDHLCRNPGCVNPEHLEPVTPRVNKLRGGSPHAQQARQTHCIHGHPFDEENTYITPKGHRQCRTCRREALRRLAQRRRSG